jgi:hypothetical protein
LQIPNAQNTINQIRGTPIAECTGMDWKIKMGKIIIIKYLDDTTTTRL